MCVHEIGFYFFVHGKDLLHDVRPQGGLARPFQVSDDLPDQVELHAARLSRRREMGAKVRQRQSGRAFGKTLISARQWHSNL